MAVVVERALVCPVCQASQGLPECCGKTMEIDGEVLFCAICEREVRVPSCCGRPMSIRRQRRDLKKEIFGGL